MTKKDKQKPYAWTNDAEIDKLLLLNQKIHSGMTVEGLKRELEARQEALAKKEDALEKAKADLKSFYKLKEQISVVFEGKQSVIFTKEQAQKTLQRYGIHEDNYHNIEALIRQETENVQSKVPRRGIENSLLPERGAVKSTSDLQTMKVPRMGYRKYSERHLYSITCR